jgi:hypothetical protein
MSSPERYGQRAAEPGSSSRPHRDSMPRRTVDRHVRSETWKTYPVTVKERTNGAIDSGLDVLGAGVSAVPFAGGPTAGLLQAWTNRQLRHADRELARAHAALEQVIEALSGRIDQLEARIGDPNFDEFLDDALSEASRATTQEAQRLIGQIIAVGVTKGPGPAGIILEAVSGLKAGHLELLVEFGKIRGAFDAGYLWRPSPPPPHTLTGLRRTVSPENVDVIDPMLATLESRGLIRQVEAASREPRNAFAGRANAAWALTMFGQQVVEFLHHEPGTNPEATESVIRYVVVKDREPAEAGGADQSV